MNRCPVVRCSRSVLVLATALAFPMYGVAADTIKTAGLPAQKSGGANFYNLLALVLVVFLVKVGLVALQILYGVIRPDAIRNGRDRLNASPRKTAGAGVLALLVAGLFIVLIQAVPDPIKRLLDIVLVLWLAWVCVKGLAVVSCEVGERVQAAVGGLGIGSDVLAVACGAVLLALCDLVPGVGWILDLCILFLALGIGVTDVRGRNAADIPTGEASGGGDRRSESGAPDGRA